MNKVLGYIFLLAVVLVIGVGIGRLTTRAQQTPTETTVPSKVTRVVTAPTVPPPVPVPTTVLATPAPPEQTMDRSVAYQSVVSTPDKVANYESARGPGYIGTFGGADGVEIRENGIFRYYQSIGFNLYGKWKRTGTEPDGRPRLLLTADPNKGGWTKFDVAYDKRLDCIVIQIDKYHPDAWIQYPRVR
jgi:hypothetical protein